MLSSITGHQLEGRRSSLINSENFHYTQLLYFYFHAFSCSISLYILHVTVNAAARFSLSTVTVSAESVDGPTPAARVSWNTTVPPQCMTSVRVEFRTSRTGPVVATNTITNTSQTEIIQTGLQCATNYYITVIVTGKTSAHDGLRFTRSSRQVQVFIGGKKKIVYIGLINNYS